MNENIKIAIIDDEEEICRTLSRLLQAEGYNVVSCTSGTKGLELIKKERVDLALVDFKMPDIDGITVIRKIKEFDQSIMAIIVTGRPSLDSVKEAIRIGASDYIIKPFDIKEVFFAIDNAIAFRILSLENKRLMAQLAEKNLVLTENVKDRTRELSLLYEIGQDVLSSIKLDEVLKTIVERITSVLDLEICSILLYDEASGLLSIKASCGLSGQVIKETMIALGKGISGWVLENRTPILVEDIEKDDQFKKISLEKYYTHSFISVPLIIKDKLIGVININNKASGMPFNNDDLRLARGIAAQAAIAIENAKLYASLEETYMRSVLSLTSALDARDHYTKAHSEHVKKFAVAIAREIGFPDSEIEKLNRSCQLHDLGKIGIQDSILTKEGKLTSQEWETVKTHSLRSVEILRPLLFLQDSLKCIEQHHERYDGKGYPYGLKGEGILLPARILAIADSFDAMVTDRPYRKALSLEDAVSELKKGKGSQFDSELVDVFLEIIEKNPDIITASLDT
ncbi:MAG: HD domain-containing phosphohydrolase [Candidatus Omnitrophota bacterium]